jgi:hypothetical protein
MPETVMTADSKFLKPSIGLVPDLIPRWSWLDQVVQVLRGPQFRAPAQQAVLSHLTDCAMRRSIAIEGDRVRRPTVIPDRLFEECLGCGYISCPTDPEVESLPSLVHCPIQTGPLSAHLEMGFIDSPRAASAPAKAIPPLDELWRIPSNPAQDRRMRKLESSFGHHLHQITEAELVAQIRAEAENGSSRCKTHIAAAGGRKVSTDLDTRRRDAGSSPIADTPSQTGADTYSGQERIAAPHAESGNAEKAEAVEHGGPGGARMPTAGAMYRSTQDWRCWMLNSIASTMQ